MATFFQLESQREQKQAEAMLQYLNERGGQYCNKDIKVKAALKMMVEPSHTHMCVTTTQAYTEMYGDIWRLMDTSIPNMDF